MRRGAPPRGGAQADAPQVQDVRLGEGPAGEFLKPAAGGGAQPLQCSDGAGVCAGQAVRSGVFRQEGAGTGQIAYEIADAVRFQGADPGVGLLQAVEHLVAQQVGQRQEAELVRGQIRGLLHGPLPGVEGA
jgi:hypothetical protein